MLTQIYAWTKRCVDARAMDLSWHPSLALIARSLAAAAEDVLCTFVDGAGFDINFSYESDTLSLEESKCDVLWVGYSSEEACELFQPSDSPGYVPASAVKLHTHARNSQQTKKEREGAATL